MDRTYRTLALALALPMSLAAQQVRPDSLTGTWVGQRAGDGVTVRRSLLPLYATTKPNGLKWGVWAEVRADTRKIDGRGFWTLAGDSIAWKWDASQAPEFEGARVKREGKQLTLAAPAATGVDLIRPAMTQYRREESASGATAAPASGDSLTAAHLIGIWKGISEDALMLALLPDGACLQWSATGTDYTAGGGCDTWSLSGRTMNLGQYRGNWDVALEGRTLTLTQSGAGAGALRFTYERVADGRAATTP